MATGPPSPAPAPRRPARRPSIPARRTGGRAAPAGSSSTTTTMTSEPRVLNERFTLVLRLGSGGQARVWLAEDRLLARSVAIKQVLLKDGGEDTAAMRIRAIGEARAMARIRHPAIVRVHDIMFTGGDEATG